MNLDAFSIVKIFIASKYLDRFLFNHFTLDSLVAIKSLKQAKSSCTELLQWNVSLRWIFKSSAKK